MTSPDRMGITDMLDDMDRASDRLLWITYLVASVGILAIAVVCLAFRVPEITKAPDVEQAAITWELR